MTVMTSVEAIATLKKLEGKTPAIVYEMVQQGAMRASRDADQVICQFLELLGYHDVVVAWEKVRKWYG